MNNEDRLNLEKLEHRLIDLTMSVDSLNRGLRGDPENQQDGVVHKVRSVSERLESMEQSISEIKQDMTQLQKFRGTVIRVAAAFGSFVSFLLYGTLEFFKKKFYEL